MYVTFKETMNKDLGNLSNSILTMDQTWKPDFIRNVSEGKLLIPSDEKIGDDH